MRGKGPMEMHNVSLRGIRVDPLAHELATSEGTRPYLDCLIKAYCKNAVGHRAALRVIRDLPLEKRYTWRVFSALKWAFAVFEDEYVGLDLPHIPEPTRSEMTKELETAVPAVADVAHALPQRIRTGQVGIGVVRAAEATRTYVYARTPEV